MFLLFVNSQQQQKLASIECLICEMKIEIFLFENIRKLTFALKSVQSWNLMKMQRKTFSDVKYLGTSVVSHLQSLHLAFIAIVHLVAQSLQSIFTRTDAKLHKSTFRHLYVIFTLSFTSSMSKSQQV